MSLPERLRPSAEATFDPTLNWDELVAVVAAVLGEELEEVSHDWALRFLELNLPGAEVAKLIQWPGEWLGNRWYEEAALTAEEVVGHCLVRCGREVPGDPGLEL